MSEFFEGVLFVIVLYKRKLQETSAYESVTAIRSPSHSVYVYDNSPMGQEINERNFFYCHDPQNPGVSRAYNKAFELAQQLGKAWLLLMDQDSQIPVSTFRAYPVAAALFNHYQVFVPVMRDGKKIISPYKIRFGKGHSPATVTPGTMDFTQYYIINSGMLIRVEEFAKAGGYDEEFPVDFSDVVFCERLRTKEKSFVLINGNGTHKLSANDTAQSHAEAQSRFLMFVKALRLYKRKYKTSQPILFTLFSRALRLSLKYRDSIYLRLAFRKTQAPT